MSQYNTSSTSEVLKKIYGDDITNLIPNTAVLTKRVGIEKKKPFGDSFNQPVQVSREHGFTFSAVGSVPTLNTAVAAVVKNAAVSPVQNILRSQVSYELASRATNNETSFGSEIDIRVKAMLDGGTFRTEVCGLHGGSGIGVTASSVNTNATTTVVTFTTAEWSDAIWGGMENATVDFYNGSSIVNSTGALTVSTVNIGSKAVTLTGASADISALDSAISSSPSTVVAYFRGAYGVEMSGLRTQFTNTGSLFGINATTYSLWQGNTHSANNAPISKGAIDAAAQKAVGRGLNGNAVLLLNPKSWGNLNTNEGAFRVYDQSYKSAKGVNGFRELMYQSSAGDISIIPDPYVKEGEAFLFPIDKLMRLASQDWSFMPTEGNNEEYLWNAPDAAAYELRIYTDQVFFMTTPAQCVYINNISNS